MSGDHSDEDRAMEPFGNTRQVFIFGAGFLVGLLVGVTFGIAVF